MASDPRFSVYYDQSKGRLYTKLLGFWSLSDVAAFGEKIRDALSVLGEGPRRFDTLSDGRGFPVQLREVSEALSDLERAGASHRVGRVAIVVGSMINKFQASRSHRVDVGVFLTMEEAERWLDTTKRASQAE